jgi:excisionase family DNA binding protein
MPPETPTLGIGFGLAELRATITVGRLFLTVGEFSEFYRCDERTARRGIERGDVPAVRVGSTIRIPVAALMQMAGLEEITPDSSEGEPASPLIASTPMPPQRSVYRNDDPPAA